MFKASVDAMLEKYWEASPRALSAMERLYSAPGGYGADQISYDHIAFRTFGLPGLGIGSVAAALECFGFTRQGYLDFPGRNVTAAWFAPPPAVPGGPPTYGQLPKVLVSQVEVSRLSQTAQATIRRHAAGFPTFGPSAAWAAALTKALPWGDVTPTWDEYAALLQESEYAAWVLVNGYTPACMALACHRLAAPHPGDGGGGGLAGAIARLQSRGFALNEEGGAVVRASEDGLLLQSATVADLIEFWFAGEREPFLVPGSYLALVERLPLPQFSHLLTDELGEGHLRQGFDAAACDLMFESTALAAKQAGVAAAAAAAGGTGE